MKILSVVGARPQFIKAAMLSHALEGRHEEVLVHTGQHYDYNMSEVFFTELDIPKPAYNLGISGGSHAEMTARMLVALEKTMLAEKPELVMLYGDTNSTLAAALAAAKLYILVCHMEAGVRKDEEHPGVFPNPEEINRVLTDRISTYLMCCTERDVASLRREGRTEHVYFTGDLMYDAFAHYARRLGDRQPEPLLDFDGNPVPLPDSFYYLTCHREENTREDEPLRQILLAMEELDAPAVYPVHPRNRERAQRLRRELGLTNIVLCQPVGYLMSVYLTSHAKKIVTDSGGLQREAFFAQKQCVTLLRVVLWPDTMVGGRNRLVRPERADILEKLSQGQEIDPDFQPFGDGTAAQKTVDILTRLAESGR